MINTPGFQCYTDYVGIKNHFNNEKFNWNPSAIYKRIKLSSFDKRNDQAFFRKLERECKERSAWINNLISGFLFSTSLWIGQLFEDDVIDFHTRRLSRIKSLESLFQRECEKMDFLTYDLDMTFENVLLTSNDKDPIILSWYIKKEISLETLAILHKFTQWMDCWNPINPLQKERRLQLNKYLLLLNLTSYNYAKIEEAYNQLAQTRVSAHRA